MRVSVGNLESYRAIDVGLIPGVTRESLRSDRTKMFSDGMICVPTWIREELGLNDGDSFHIAVSPDGCISLKKVQQDEESDRNKATIRVAKRLQGLETC